VVEDNHEQHFSNGKANISADNILECLENDIPEFPCLGFGDKFNFDMFVVVE
jgi:hypothetical protein